MSESKPSVLVFSTIYPSSARPNVGIYLETRLRHLLSSNQATAAVVAPVPWFPSTREIFGRYARMALTPEKEQRAGIEVRYPRFLVIPKVGLMAQPFALASAGARAAEALSRDGFQFDLIDAHYFFPDGVAAAKLAAKLGKPFVVTAHGSDINLIARFPPARRLIIEAARRAARVITVSAALRRTMIELGVSPDHISVLRNGVDLSLFRPISRSDARRELGLPAEGTTIASVGNLLPVKGHELVIAAAKLLPDIEAVIVGEGPQRSTLQRLIARLGLDQRVRLLGAMPQARLRSVYSACDALVLASSREGWPNVPMEAMACGIPVVASRVGGVPEIISDPRFGRLVDERTPPAFAQAISELLRTRPDRESVRAFAERYSWDATAAGQLEVFRGAIRDYRGAPQ